MFEINGRSFKENTYLLNSGIPTFKMKTLNLFKSNSIKKKPSRNIFYDEKYLSKNNENTLILSDPSINIFYKKELNKISKNEIKSQEISNDNILSKTNYYSVKNKKLLYDSFSQGSLLNNKTNISNLSDITNKNQIKFPKLSMTIKKNYFRNLSRNKKLINNLEYKKKLKNIESSFSPKSFYSLEKKMFKELSSKNILFDNSLFSKHKTEYITKSSIKKVKNIKFKYNKSFMKEKINFNGKIVPNRNIYKIIVDPLPYGKTDDTKDLSENLKKIDRKVEKILEMDNKKIFTNNYSIIEKFKFKKEFQNPFIYDSKNYNGNGEKYKNIINLNVIKEHLKLLKEMKEEVNKIKEKDVIFNNYKEIQVKKINSKKILFEKFKNFIIRLTQFLKQSSLTINEIKRFKLIRHSFTYELTKILIDSIKSKNYDLCCAILEKNKYLVLDYDYYYLTPLHWAVKKNFYELIPKLLDYGSLVNSLNFSGNSPLHIAVKNNCYESACFLLYYLASPFIKNKEGKKPIEIAKEFDMKSLLGKMMKIYYLSYFKKISVQQKFIRNNLWTFMNEELKDKISEFVFTIIKDKEIYDL